MAERYIESINQGAVPNIENAWTYICQNESKSILENAINKFDDFINDEILHRLPLEEEEIKEMFKEAKKDCKEFYMTSCIGGVINEHLDELKTTMKNKYYRIIEDNERE
jgi:hypothetical protein